MQLTFLGTSSAIPTLARGLPALAVKYGRQIILFDCGEGTQQRLKETGLSLLRIDHIFCTHLHGDHVFGLPGLVQTMALNKRESELCIYVPQGEAPLLRRLLTGSRGELTYPLCLQELEEGARVDLSDDLYVATAAADHTVPGLAYRLQETPRPGRFDERAAQRLGIPQGPVRARLKRGEAVEVEGRTIRPEQVVGPSRPGRSLVYSGDTRPAPEVEALAQGVRLLIHESTFDDSHTARANEAGHSTASQAAEIARGAGANRLILTHFSQRYPTVDLLVEQARAVFSDTTAASDLERVDLRLPRK